MATQEKQFLYKELSYKIIRCLFNCDNSLGWGHKEKFYQKAVEEELKEVGLSYKNEAPVKLRYKDKVIGTYFYDFIIEGKVVLEIKVRNHFSKKDIDQLFSYLKAQNLKLGILGHFTRSGVKIKRVVNIT